MLEQSLNRIQREMAVREVEARKKGKADVAKTWELAADLVQEERRRVVGAPPEVTAKLAGEARA